MSPPVADWLRSGKHLPPPLRDFHDQKDVFKSLHEWAGPLEEGEKRPSWIEGHCYVIDLFLRFMAAHGWTLQRSRKPVEFASLADTIKQRRDREVKQLQEMFAQSRAPRTDEVSE